MQDNQTSPICDLHVETTGNDTTQVVCCTIYSYLPTDTTADGEWEWAELIGLLDDECMRVCNSARAEQGKAWRDASLLHPNNLRDAVLARTDILIKYNEIGFPAIEQWLATEPDRIMEANRPNYL